MQIPYEVQARPDTGLYNAKLGIWLFLASEVMLFGGLFSAFIFLRMGADDGYWPHGLLNVPVGTMNTAILILSSVTVIRAWMSLKMRRFSEYKKWMGLTIICAFIFLGVKLCIEWPQKFAHFGAIIRKDKQELYEKNLGNEFVKSKGLPPRNEISGHLEAVEFTVEAESLAAAKAFADRKDCVVEDVKHEAHEAAAGEHAPEASHAASPLYKLEHKTRGAGFWPSVAEGLEKIKGVKLIAFEVMPGCQHQG